MSDSEDEFDYEHTDLLKDKSLFNMLTSKFCIPESVPVEGKLEIVKNNLQDLIKVKNACDITGILTNN